MYKKVSVVLGALALMVALVLTGPTFAQGVDGPVRADEAGTANSHGRNDDNNGRTVERDDPREDKGRDSAD